MKLLETAVCLILDFGTTSGSDMLHGFIRGLQVQSSTLNSPTPYVGGQIDYTDTHKKW